MKGDIDKVVDKVVAVFAALLEFRAVCDPVIFEETQAEGAVGLGAVKRGGEIVAIGCKCRSIFREIGYLAVNGLAKKEFAG